MASKDQPVEVIPQVCSVPFRRHGDGVEFCLITSLKKKRWIFPKGIVDPGETVEETALKESFEEAGLDGNVLGPPLGEYEDSKWGALLSVTVVLMEVTRCEANWPEAEVRQRRWVAAEDATELLAKESMRNFAQAAVARIASPDFSC